MTLKYESEILFDLMKRDGVSSPSDVLPYESELKEKYLNQVVGAYPKLQDYRPEWLNYNLYHHLPSEFPVESVTNVTNASFHDVVPYVYKSVILKGNTIKNYKNNLFDNILENGMIDVLSGIPNQLNLKSYRSVNFIPINGNFKIAKYGIYGDLHVCFYDSNKSFISSQTYVLRKVLEGNAIVTPPTNSSFIKFYNPYDADEPTGEFRFGVMAENEIIELEIQSVKLPVLTTSNEDGTKTNILTVNEDVTLRSNGNVYDELDLLTGKLTQRIDEDGSVLTQEVVKTVDLSCINEQGESATFRPIEGTMHVSTSSQTLPPLLDMSVPVEATTQNLMSFANIVEEE